MEDNTTENKKFFSSVLDLLFYPEFFTSGKARPHGHRYGKKEGCNEFHTVKQLQRRGVERNNTKTFTIDLSATSGSERR